ncbi:MAG: sulfotransferase [Acidimicrobiales bacterium]|nr:sulfotransferase [Acidimicrobiales bacterium]
MKPSDRLPLRFRPPLHVPYRRLCCALQHLRRHAAAPEPLRQKTLLFVVCEPRTGSNLLISYLNQLDGIRLEGELLHVNRFRDIHFSPSTARAELDRQLLALDGDIVGCKLMIHQLEHAQLGFSELKQRYPQARFVLLYRQSLIDQFISSRLARQTKQYQQHVVDRSAPGTAPELSFRSTRDQLSYHCGLQRRRYRWAFRALGPATALLSYEELVADPVAAVNLVLLSFGREVDRLGSSALVKQQTRDPREVLLNYDELIGDPNHPSLWLAPPFGSRSGKRQRGSPPTRNQRRSAR